MDTCDTFFFFYPNAKSRSFGERKMGGKVTKIVEEAPSVRSRNDRARGAAVAAQESQTEVQAAGGDPDAAAAAAAARVCPQPGTRRQRRRRTWQVQRPRSPGSRAPSELPSGSPRCWPRATRTPRCRVSELSWKVVEQTLPQWSRQQEEEEEKKEQAQADEVAESRRRATPAAAGRIRL